MINTQQKTELLSLFAATVKESAEKNLKDLDLYGFCKAGQMDLVKKSIDKIRANVMLSIPEGYSIPKASLYVNGTGNGDDVTVISVVLANGWKDPQEFRFANQFAVGENIVDAITSFFQASYEELFLNVLADENLQVVNETLAELSAKAGITYKVAVVSPIGQGSKKIAYISDDEVDFVADPDKLFDVDDILIFQAPDEIITVDKIEAAKQPLVDELGLAQTPVQLVGAHGGSLIKYLCGIGPQVKAITMIRKVNNKNAERLTGKKDTTAYYEKDGVYSVVARRDGKFEVLLKPFDIKTLETVDLDVVGELSA